MSRPTRGTHGLRPTIRPLRRPPASMQTRRSHPPIEPSPATRRLGFSGLAASTCAGGPLRRSAPFRSTYPPPPPCALAIPFCLTLTPSPHRCLSHRSQCRMPSPSSGRAVVLAYRGSAGRVSTLAGFHVPNRGRDLRLPRRGQTKHSLKALSVRCRGSRRHYTAQWPQTRHGHGLKIPWTPYRPSGRRGARTRLPVARPPTARCRN